MNRSTYLTHRFIDLLSSRCLAVLLLITTIAVLFAGSVNIRGTESRILITKQKYMRFIDNFLNSRPVPMLARGFVYLVAVIDWYSRKVLSWRLSNTLDSRFCVNCLEQALQEYGIPETFNTDQGCQFTSEAFTGVLKANSVVISMDGRGRALDNIFVERLWRRVIHEDVYLKGYATLPDLLLGLKEYFVFYNSERMHQSLGYNTPDQVYRTASGGGARIVDKYNESEKTLLEIETKKNQKARAALFRCM